MKYEELSPLQGKYCKLLIASLVNTELSPPQGEYCNKLKIVRDRQRAIPTTGGIPRLFMKKGVPRGTIPITGGNIWRAHKGLISR